MEFFAYISISQLSFMAATIVAATCLFYRINYNTIFFLVSFLAIVHFIYEIICEKTGVGADR